MNSHNDNTKTVKDTIIRCRVTKDFKERLENYCKENNTTKSKVIVKGVETVIKK